MKRGKFFLRFLLAIGILTAFQLSGCDTDLNGVSPDMELAVTASSASNTGIYRRYTPRGSIIPYWGARDGVPNCTAFAWQNMRIPISVPDYGLLNAQPFIDDGSYYKLPSTEKPQTGDRVVYGDWSHSAVVYSVTDGNITVISYWIRDIDPVTNRPIIRYLPVNTWPSPTYYRVSDERYWQTPNVLRRKVAFQSLRNGMYVCADLNYGTDGPLYTNRKWIQEWETFYLIKADGQNVHIWSQATFNYVTASGTSRAIANSYYYDAKDNTFLVFEWGGYTFILWPVNGKHLRQDSFKAEGSLSTDTAFYMKDL